MPSTDHYLTYDGSFTQPGCWEGVTWIVLNKPIYLSRNDFDLLRTLVQGEDRASPKSKLYPNVRPLQVRPLIAGSGLDHLVHVPLSFRT